MNILDNNVKELLIAMRGRCYDEPPVVSIEQLCVSHGVTREQIEVWRDSSPYDGIIQPMKERIAANIRDQCFHESVITDIESEEFIDELGEWQPTDTQLHHERRYKCKKENQ